MRSVTDWKTLLRAALKEEMRARRAAAVSVLRDTLAAIDNAEAAELSAAPLVEAGVIAGGVAGLGTGDVARKSLTSEEVTGIVQRELAERREAAVQYVSLGRTEEAETLRAQADLLAALLTRE
jgi:uncharacterized protein